MTKRKLWFNPILVALLIWQGGGLSVFAQSAHRSGRCTLAIHADRVFDGFRVYLDATVIMNGDVVESVNTTGQRRRRCRKEMDLGDATLSPGFIDLHGHVTFQEVSRRTVLEHGITTVRDIGGPLHFPEGGIGELRLLTSGPILQAPSGYPLNLFAGRHGDGHHAANMIAIEVQDEADGRRLVQHFVDRGAVVIKIALEPGGEAGAPWSADHGHGGGPVLPWPMLEPAVVAAIVEEAHKQGVLVTAHVGEEQGLLRALDAGVDELSHVPCAPISDVLLQRIIDQDIKVVTTIDTLRQCHGTAGNAHKMAHRGVEFLYGAEVAHPDIPWGFDAQELLLLLQLTGMTPLDVLKTATSQAGTYLGIPGLGTFLPGAPADLVAVLGNGIAKFKLFEYPDIVVSGGKLVVDKTEKIKRSKRPRWGYRTREF